ncbi:MAG: radical SAM protein [Lachnospiraceae bacterium]|nr:radical SAM protein [Lachnospiraceae bacterium]
MTNYIRLHQVVFHTKVLGPGMRAAIWLQGCKRRCKGCMSPASRPLHGGTLAGISSVANAILSLEDIEGITVSGGEPFLQPEALCTLLGMIREKADLGVIIYTGYTHEQLRQMQNRYIDQILDELTDLLIDGEYVDELNDGKSLRGSSNQRILYLTDRYLPYKDIYDAEVRNVEAMISEREVFFVGIPNRETWNQWESVVNGFDPETIE